MRARIMSAKAVRDARRIADVRNAAREPFGDPEPALGQRQQHDAAVRSDPTAIEGGADFLAGAAGKEKAAVVSSSMAGVARGCLGAGLGQSPVSP